jgi:uncharacterized protein (DUF305 family)
MKNKRIIIVIVAIALVVIVGGITTYILAQGQMTKQADRSLDSATYKEYAALKGEEYDKTFISNMIVHHESAMNMAEMASVSAKRQEIKDLAMNIASSQGKEVSEMATWQKQWGYPETSGHMMVDAGDNASHSMEGMATMNDELNGLAGDTFDRKFLELMIVHHQGAIDMAAPAEKNAYHQEIKDLAKTIIATQQQEIDKMLQWQRNWGFAITDPSNPSFQPSTKK